MTKLNPASLDWALQHALAEGDTDIFPPVFEYAAIKADWPTVRSHLASKDVEAWVSRPLRRTLSSKGRYGFRLATQLDPLDFLVFTALVYELGEDFEASRCSRDVAMSYRFQPDPAGTLYDRVAGFTAFQNRSRRLSRRFPYVVVTDIADFFPRLYHHRIEGAVSTATAKDGHVRGLTRLLKSWTQRQSYGIPVGPSASRLIAEVSINDVDRMLLSEGVTFVRYMDDYRIFARSRNEAYQQLVALANALFANHGLTLQQEKTRILPSAEFRNRYCGTEESREVSNLSEKFDSFLHEIGVSSPYEDIDYEDLDDEHKEMVDSLNLGELLQEQFDLREIDQKMTRFLLRRLAQINDQSCLDELLENLDTLFTVIPDVVQYLRRLSGLDQVARHGIGSQLVDFLSSPDSSQLEFHKTWIFDLLADGQDWGVGERLGPLYSGTQEGVSRRELILAFAKAKRDYWFRSRKDRVTSFDPWDKRAFLAGASCLPVDEHENWYRSQRQQLDVLEKAVIDWAQANPL
ncbi:MAG: reverse transcriptase domain-containing protein [Chloroflexi bacterium]|nr:reverse transcriptase domain-containing protein [Chloroflexota bacterium]